MLCYPQTVPVVTPREPVTLSKSLKVTQLKPSRVSKFHRQFPYLPMEEKLACTRFQTNTFFLTGEFPFVLTKLFPLIHLNLLMSSLFFSWLWLQQTFDCYYCLPMKCSTLIFQKEYTVEYTVQFIWAQLLSQYCFLSLGNYRVFQDFHTFGK